MHSPAMIYITNHHIELQAEAAANRLAKEAKRSASPSRSRISATLNSLRSLLANPSEGPMPLPKLNEYPYRS